MMFNEPKIYSVVYGKTTLPESSIFQNGNSEKERSIVFAIYYIKLGNRKILIDAGCDTMPGFIMTDFISPREALGKIGVVVDEITDVCITHAHHDHIEAVKYFKNAIIHINKEEYEHGGMKYIPDNFKLNIFEDDCDIMENLKMITIAGHSVGSCVVQVKIGTKTYIFAGDECYMDECLIKSIPTGQTYDIEKSTEFVKEYRQDKYSVLLCHDPKLRTQRVI